MEETRDDTRRNGSVILLTRRGSRNVGRNILNEREVEKLLKQRYGDRFILFQGGYSLDESIAMFSQARIVIGVHGGAFYNINFSPSSTRVVEIMPLTDEQKYLEKLAVDIFWKISQFLGQHYFRIYHKQTGYYGDVSVDLEVLQIVLDRIDAMDDILQ